MKEALELELVELEKEFEAKTKEIEAISEGIDTIEREIVPMLQERNALMNELLEENPFSEQVQHFRKSKWQYFKAVSNAGKRYFTDDLDIIYTIFEAMVVMYDSKEFKRKDFRSFKPFFTWAEYAQAYREIAEQVKKDYDSEFAAFFEQKVNELTNLFPQPKKA